MTETLDGQGYDSSELWVNRDFIPIRSRPEFLRFDKELKESAKRHSVLIRVNYAPISDESMFAVPVAAVSPAGIPAGGIPAPPPGRPRP
jgi:hypothetical protein